MKTVGIIPARMGSSRFPGKPLKPILGMAMVEHVYARCALSPVLDETWVATCDDEIASAVKAFGGDVIMTSPAHETAADRVAEAARTVGGDIVVMVQGDEPLIHPQVLKEVVRPLLVDESIVCANPMRVIESEEEYLDPNCIKVCVDKDDYCLFMTREPIPTSRRLGFAGIPVFRQLVLVPFRRDFLERFASWERGPLEKAESVDMLRVLENGGRIKMVRTSHRLHAVDCPDDLARVERMMKNDPIYTRYA